MLVHLCKDDRKTRDNKLAVVMKVCCSDAFCYHIKTPVYVVELRLTLLQCIITVFKLVIYLSLALPVCGSLVF